MASLCSARVLFAQLLLVVGLLWVMSASHSTAKVAVRAEDDTQASAATRPVTANDTPWRRTNRGWERTTDWPGASGKPSIAMARPVMHPLVLAAFLLLASLGSLLAAEKDPLAAVAVRPGR